MNLQQIKNILQLKNRNYIIKNDMIYIAIKDKLKRHYFLNITNVNIEKLNKILEVTDIEELKKLLSC